MSVLRDSHRCIVSVTVVYVYTSNAICSLLHEFLLTVCEGLQSAIDQVTNQPISTDRRKIVLVNPIFRPHGQ